jgi:hypothetical protein
MISSRQCRQEEAKTERMPATFLQIVRESQFQSFEEIEIRLVLKNIYNNWPRSRQTLKNAVFGRHSCARTGSYRLAGPVRETLYESVAC